MYKVIETPMYPCKFKVVNYKYREDNATCNFFRTREEAQKVADKRNKVKASLR